MRVKKVAVALLTAAVLSLVTLAVRRLFHSPDITQPPDEVQKEDGTSCDAGRWSDWSLCDKKCVRHRRRLQSQYDQLQPLCDPVVQQQTCPAAWCTPSQQSMHSEDCATPWSNWSPCSATCGIGYRVRSREGTSNGPCILHESEKCADLPPCPLITCDSPHQATNLDDMYFAKGYAKTAWRGEYMGNPVVIKRPVTESDLHLQRFMAGMQAEAKWLQELSPLSQHIMRFYGSCDQGEHPFSVVEGNLAKFDWLSRTHISACFRLHLALQVMHLVSFLDDQHLFHCDWKFDQTAVDFDGIMKLVDLKSLYSTEAGRYKSDLECTTDEDCKRCLKAMTLEVDQSCDTTTGHCRGYDTTSLIYATAQSFWTELILDHKQHIMQTENGRALYAHMSDVMQVMLAPNPDDRPTPAQVLEMLKSSEKDVCGAAGGAAQLSQHDREVLHKAFAANMRSSHDRCKKRYC